MTTGRNRWPPAPAKTNSWLATRKQAARPVSAAKHRFSKSARRQPAAPASPAARRTPKRPRNEPPNSVPRALRARARCRPAHALRIAQRRRLAKPQLARSQAACGPGSSHRQLDRRHGGEPGKTTCAAGGRQGGAVLFVATLRAARQGDHDQDGRLLGGETRYKRFDESCSRT